MVIRVVAMICSITIAGMLALGGGGGVRGARAAGTGGNASQACSKAGNAVFGSGVPISHGACVSTIRSKGHSSALYASLCRYAVHSNGGMLPTGLAPNTSVITNSTIAAILSHVTVPTNGFTSVGQCMKAFNAAKHAAFHTSSSTTPTGSSEDNPAHGQSGTHGHSGEHGNPGNHGKGHP